MEISERNLQAACELSCCVERLRRKAIKSESFRASLAQNLFPNGQSVTNLLRRAQPESIDKARDVFNSIIKGNGKLEEILTQSNAEIARNMSNAFSHSANEPIKCLHVRHFSAVIIAVDKPQFAFECKSDLGC